MAILGESRKGSSKRGITKAERSEMNKKILIEILSSHFNVTPFLPSFKSID